MFANTLLLYYTNKLPGSIFLNYYLEGLASIFGYLISLLVINNLSTRWAMFSANFFLTSGALLTLVFEAI